jgi:hypothetical protein
MSAFFVIFTLYQINIMITASIPLSTLSRYKVQKIAKLTIDFCTENFGKTKNKSWPTTYISWRSNTSLIGEYDPFNHDIWVWVKNCPTVMELVKTIIHEWTHSKQRILTEYQKLHRKFGYKDNPLEIEAYAAEKIWGRKALNYVKKNWTSR